MIRPYVSIALAVLIIIFGVEFYSWHKQEIKNFFSKSDTAVESIGIEDREFVIKGSNLTKVAVWGVPTGTNIAESDHIHLGNARLTSEVGEEETWKLAIPKDPLLVTHIYAYGYAGTEIAEKVDLAIQGATDIYNALWGNIVNQAKTGEMVLSPGESKVWNELTVVFNTILEDSRCAIDVVCIQAGTLKAAMSLRIGTENHNITLSDRESTVTYKGYSISMGEIAPPKTSSITPQNTKYSIKFLITKL